MQRQYYYGRYIQDGLLDAACGRIVIYNNHILHANGPSADHNYLLRSLAARDRINKDEVISNAIRLYFRREPDRIVISPVRKIDDEDFERHTREYTILIKQTVK